MPPSSPRGRSRACKHRIELRLLALDPGVIQARREALALDRVLREAVYDLRHLNAEKLVDRRCDVDRMRVLRPNPGLLDPCRPRDDHRIGRATLIARVALPHLERRVEGPGPAGRVMVVRLRRSQFVEVLECFLDRVGQPVEQLILVHRPVRTTFARGAVIGNENYQGVVELAGLLEVVEHASKLVVGVAKEACVDLRHPREEAASLSARPTCHRPCAGPWWPPVA